MERNEIFYSAEHFWRTDVKAHRDYYKAVRKEGGDKRQPLNGIIGSGKTKHDWDDNDEGEMKNSV